MTVEELIDRLRNLPQEAIVMYRHNKHGRVDIDTIECQEELLLSGRQITTVTLSGLYEED